MSRIMIHQPEYLPWPNYFSKIMLADTVVFLDTVQYARRSFQNRNQIKTPGGAKWLTVPLAAAPRHTRIDAIRIDNGRPWRREHRQRLQAAYGSAPFFSAVWEILDPILNREWTALSPLNIHLTETLARHMGLTATFIQASELQKKIQQRRMWAGEPPGDLGQKSDLIFNICRELDAKRYITGDGSRSYLNEADFFQAGMAIDYVAPVTFTYRQRFPRMEFIPHLSTIDLLFNEGFDHFRPLAETLLVGAVESREGVVGGG